MKIPIAEVKQSWHATLAQMPELALASVHPAWPGPDLLYALVTNPGTHRAAIWFGATTTAYERHSMRADRQRRIVTATFPVLIEVLVAGTSNDIAKDPMPAGLLAEQIAYDLWQPIDEHIADEKHLSRPDIVNSVVVDGDTADAGFTDTGFGYRLSMPVIAEFRLL